MTESVLKKMERKPRERDLEISKTKRAGDAKEEKERERMRNKPLSCFTLMGFCFDCVALKTASSSFVLNMCFATESALDVMATAESFDDSERGGGS